MRIHIVSHGNFGNRALQVLAAHGIKSHAPAATIQNILLPECGLNLPAPTPATHNTVTTGRGWLDIAGLADCLTRGVIETILLDDYPFHLENFPTRAAAKNLIPPLPGGQSAAGFGPADLVCSIRAAEILTGIHPDYLPLPPAYYQHLQTRTGLNLVFFGQIEDNPYIQSLRNTFPREKFISGVNPDHDFETLRRSAHIAPSVSTFAWLAAWLSDAQSVFLPVCGFLSPAQHKNMLFLPLDDPSYHFTLFPYARAENLHDNPAKFFLGQDHLARHLRPATPAELRQIIARIHPPRLHVNGFDPDFYQSLYPDIRQMVEAGCPSALHHYVTAGAALHLQSLPLDPAFYAVTYPEAANSIAEGHYDSPLHHFQAVGKAKGYRNLP